MHALQHLAEQVHVAACGGHACMYACTRSVQFSFPSSIACARPQQVKVIRLVR